MPNDLYQVFDLRIWENAIRDVKLHEFHKDSTVPEMNVIGKKYSSGDPSRVVRLLVYGYPVVSLSGMTTGY